MMTGDAASAWQRFAAIIFETGRLTIADLPALELLCETWAEWRAAKEIADDPNECYVTSENGGVYAHPAVSRAQAARKMINVLFARFGLTPLDRGQLGGATVAKSKGGGLAAFAATRDAKAK